MKILREKGFSLVEVLIALVLVCMIAFIVTASSDQLQNAMNKCIESKKAKEAEVMEECMDDGKKSYECKAILADYLEEITC